MNRNLKENAKTLIALLAAGLELKLEDVFKEYLPDWKETSPKERHQICLQIARFWLIEETKRRVMTNKLLAEVKEKLYATENSSADIPAAISDILIYLNNQEEMGTIGTVAKLEEVCSKLAGILHFTVSILQMLANEDNELATAALQSLNKEIKKDGK